MQTLRAYLDGWKAPTKRKLGVRIEHKFEFKMSNNSALVLNCASAHRYRIVTRAKYTIIIREETLLFGPCAPTNHMSLITGAKQNSDLNT